MEPAHDAVILRPGAFTVDDLVAVAARRRPVAIDPAAMERARRSREALEAALARGGVIYGVNTGFGKLSSVILPDDQADALQRDLLRSHACGVGEPFPEDVVRAMMALRIVSLLRGHSGIRPEVIRLLAGLLNAGVHPVVPQQGSLGASGDLAPLAHLALVLIGEGEAVYRGERLPGREALARAGLAPVELRAKEGLALINGTQAMTATGALAWWRACRVADAADAAAALTMEALDGVIDAFREEIQAVRPYPEQADVASRIRRYLEGSRHVRPSTPEKVQDAYALRCVPQVHGASRRALRHVEATLAIEMNAATDNPLVFPDEGVILSGGNFHGQPVALALDYLKIAVAELANISERRTERLVNPQLSGLPAFLTPTAGRSSGLMILQYVAAALVSENKVLAHPASVDSIPSSANQEDHVSMGTIAARQAWAVVENAARAVAIELICAAQALEYKDRAALAPFTRAVHGWVRSLVPPYSGDRSYAADIEAVAARILDGSFGEATGAGTTGSAAGSDA